MDHRRKKSFFAALGEGLAELILMLVFGAIGYGIFELFGMGERMADENFEVLVLVGIVVFCIVIIAVGTLVHKIFSKKGKVMKENKNGINIILDTDVGADCDDMMAIAYLAYAERESLINLKAVTHSNACEHGVAAARAYLKELGISVPVGHVSGDVGAYDYYAKAVAEKFGDEDCYAPAEDATAVLRRALTESYEATLLAIGPMTNIAALLRSEPDDISSLDGVSLVRERCRVLVLMAGDFTSGKPEWNVKLDISAMKTVLDKCPVPVYFLPFECGNNMITGAHLLEDTYPENPLSLSFRLFPGTEKIHGRHSWDPAAAAFAVEGAGELFSLSEPMTVSVADDGAASAIPDVRGMHRIISVKINENETEADAKRRAAEHIDECAKKLYSAY